MPLFLDRPPRERGGLSFEGAPGPSAVVGAGPMAGIAPGGAKGNGHDGIPAAADAQGGIGIGGTGASAGPVGAGPGGADDSTMDSALVLRFCSRVPTEEGTPGIGESLVAETTSILKGRRWGPIVMFRGSLPDRAKATAYPSGAPGVSGMSAASA